MKENDWFRFAVLWANDKGVANGVSTTQFNPKGNITREQVATMLKKYAQIKGYDVSASTDLDLFPDAGDVSSWATANISWAVANGIISGKGQNNGTKLLASKGEATRAECAAMLKSFCEKGYLCRRRHKSAFIAEPNLKFGSRFLRRKASAEWSLR